MRKEACMHLGKGGSRNYLLIKVWCRVFCIFIYFVNYLVFIILFLDSLRGFQRLNISPSPLHLSG